MSDTEKRLIDELDKMPVFAMTNLHLTLRLSLPCEPALREQVLLKLLKRTVENAGIS